MSRKDPSCRFENEREEGSRVGGEENGPTSLRTRGTRVVEGDSPTDCRGQVRGCRSPLSRTRQCGVVLDPRVGSGWVPRDTQWIGRPLPKGEVSFRESQASRTENSCRRQYGSPIIYGNTMYGTVSWIQCPYYCSHSSS